MLEVGPISSLRIFLRFPLEGREAQNRFAVGAALSLAALMVTLFAGFLVYQGAEYKQLALLAPGLAGLIVAVIPGLFVGGYVLRIWRQAIKGEKLELPPWEGWGRMAGDGLRLLLVNLAYTLPGLLLIGASLITYCSFVAVVMASSPRVTSDVQAALAMRMLASVLVMFAAMVIGYALVLLGLIPLPAATAHFAAEDRIAAAFHVRQWWPVLWKNKLNYFVAWSLVVGAGSICYLLVMALYYSLVLCCLAPLLSAPVFFYVALVGAAVFGQTYRESVAVPAIQYDNRS